MKNILAAPFAFRWVPVWRRNARVWRRLALASLMGNFGEPLLYLLALGFGLGGLIGEIDGLPYVVFLASGIVASSTMNTASFESMYSAYTRMTIQKTWDGMMATPLTIDDVVLGEVLWAGSKSVIHGAAILIVATALGAVANWYSLWVLPVILLTGVCFGAMALVVTALARSYDFFQYYFTLVLAPMMMFGGVFFPLSEMPLFLQKLALFFPLTHAVEIIRPLMTGRPVIDLVQHIMVLVAVTVLAYGLAVILLRRRLLA